MFSSLNEKLTKINRSGEHEIAPVFLVFLLSILLIAAVLIVNTYTERTVKNLQDNTLQASNTFATNNVLQQIVNETNQVDFRIRKKLAQRDASATQSLVDTIADIQRQLQFLKSLKTVPDSISNGLKRLDNLTTIRLRMIDSLLVQLNHQHFSENYYLGDHERKLNDSIYRLALNIQKDLEISLARSMHNGILYSERLSVTNKILSIIMIIAFATVGTFLMRRVLKHDRLIRQLQISQQKTEELAKAKDEFLANMSHEIRTPLHAVIGYTDILKSSELSDKQLKQVEILGNAAHQLYAVVNDILDIGKLEGGKLQVEKTPFQLPQLLFELNQVFENAASDRDLHLQLDIDNNLPLWVNGDPVRLRQILYNLLSNAIKFTNVGWVKTSAKVVASDDRLHQVQFTVEDTGIGIDQKHHQSIFNRFEQISGSPMETSSLKGTGLGLSIVKGLVNLLGGTMTLDSKLGSGTRFTVQLALEKVAEQQLSKVSQLETTQGQIFSGLRVLVAEDNAVNQFLLESFFEKWRVSWALAQNGQEAIEFLEEDADFDLILMDLRMPVMDGATAIQLIRKKLKLNIPIVAMTAHAENDLDTNLDKKQVSDWLHKPFYEKELARIIANHHLKKNSRYAKIPPVYSDISPVEISGLPAELERKVISVFLQTYEETLLALELAIAHTNRPAAIEHAHKMAGTLAAFGSNSIALGKLNLLRDRLKNVDAPAKDLQADFDDFKRILVSYVSRAKQNIQTQSSTA